MTLNWALTTGRLQESATLDDDTAIAVRSDVSSILQDRVLLGAGMTLARLAGEHLDALRRKSQKLGKQYLALISADELPVYASNRKWYVAPATRGPLKYCPYCLPSPIVIVRLVCTVRC